MTNFAAIQVNNQLELKLMQGDITLLPDFDAIVNAANERMLGGGGVDGAIHMRAGPELVEACRQVPEIRPGVRCPTGEARITPAFQLPSQYVIHTVGPVYRNDAESRPLLESAIRSSLALANEHQLSSVAFPAISCGVFGYPKDKAAEVFLETCPQYAGNLRTIAFVLFDQSTFDIWHQRWQAYFDSANETNAG